MSFWIEDEYVRTTVKCEVETEGRLIAEKFEKLSKQNQSGQFVALRDLNTPKLASELIRIGKVLRFQFGKDGVSSYLLGIEHDVIIFQSFKKAFLRSEVS